MALVFGFVISCFVLKFCPHVSCFAFHFLPLSVFAPHLLVYNPVCIQVLVFLFFVLSVHLFQGLFIPLFAPAYLPWFLITFISCILDQRVIKACFFFLPACLVFGSLFV